jgi:hypothetical protein
MRRVLDLCGTGSFVRAVTARSLATVPRELWRLSDSEPRRFFRRSNVIVVEATGLRIMGRSARGDPRWSPAADRQRAPGTSNANVVERG